MDYSGTVNYVDISCLMLATLNYFDTCNIVWQLLIRTIRKTVLVISRHEVEYVIRLIFFFWK